MASWTNGAPPTANRDACATWTGGTAVDPCRDTVPTGTIQAVHHLSSTLLDSGYNADPSGWVKLRDGAVSCEDL